MKLLIIEDEQTLSQNITDYLNSENYICEQAFTYDEAMMKIQLYTYDCILLDLMLPGGNGLDILQRIKEKDPSVGVIIISAKGALEDKVRGLKIGADDYLPKPFHMSELSIRIYAILRRKQFSNSNILKSNNVVIDLLKKEVRANGKLLALTRTEYELLLFLIGNKNKVISKSAMAEHLTGDMADMMDNYDFVYTHIKNLKAKLTSAGCGAYIKNIYATGYKWIE